MSTRPVDLADAVRFAALWSNSRLARADAAHPVRRCVERPVVGVLRARSSRPCSYLKRLLQINMATLAATGLLLLGMGQRSVWPPLLVAAAAAGSVWLTDVTGWFRLTAAWPTC